MKLPYIRHYVYYYEVLNGVKYPQWVQDCVTLKDAKSLAKSLTRSTNIPHYTASTNIL